MIKETVTYEDFDGNTRTEDFWFHIDKADLLELEAEKPGGMQAYLQGIIESSNNQEILRTFKRFVQMSIGKRSEDGRRFDRSDEIKNDFMQTNAYSELLFLLASDEARGAAFMAGILPAGLAKEVEDVQLPEEGKPVEIKWSDFTSQQLLDMPQGNFDKLVTMAPKDMPHELLVIAMQRKSR